MKKRNTILIASVLVLSLLLASCTPLGNRGSTGGPSISTNYRSGSQALNLRFAQNLPPAQIYDDQDVNILLEIENVGSSDLGYAGEKIYLSGFDPNILQIEPTGASVQIPTLKGKSEFGPGDFSTVSLKSRSVNLAQDVDKYSTRLLATACYGYNTIASGSICIDPDPYSTQQKVCSPTNINLGTQGAPIAVSTIGVEPSKGRTRFKITVKNVGGGTVFREGTQYLSKCSPYSSTALEYNELNYVRVEDISVGSTSILQSCNPPLDNGHMRLINGVGSMYCTLDNIQSNTAYTTSITARLSYGYKQTLFKDLTILKIR